MATRKRNSPGIPDTPPTMSAPAPARASAPAEKPAPALAIPLVEIAESPFNPRRIFKGLEELAASIRVHAVLQPILVRPAPDDFSGCKYELVCGARRFRASKLAGKLDIPAIVREIDDNQVLEIMVVENKQKEDTNPMDDAAAFAAMLQRGYTCVQIAAKIGFDETYVAQRVQLLKLADEFQQMVREEKLPFSYARVIARHSEQAQKDLLRDWEWRNWKNPDWSAPAKHRWESKLERHQRKMSKCPFAVDDANLVPEAGPCTLCPKRTGTNRALFPDVEAKDDFCMDPKCWESKEKAQFTLAREIEQAKGGDLVAIAGEIHWDEQEAAKRAKTLKALKAGEYQILNKAEAKALPADQVKTAMIVAGEGQGEKVQIQLVPNGKRGESRGNAQHDWQKREERERQERRHNAVVAKAVLLEICQAWKNGARATIGRAIAVDHTRKRLQQMYRGVETLAQLFGVRLTAKDHRAITQMEKWFETWSKSGRIEDILWCGLLAECCGEAAAVEIYELCDLGERLGYAAGMLGIDVKAIGDRVKDEEKQAAPPATPAAPKGNKPRKSARPRKATPGVCSVCGCTEDDCSGCIEKTGQACHWANDERTLCSACADESEPSDDLK